MSRLLNPARYVNVFNASYSWNGCLNPIEWAMLKNVLRQLFHRETVDTVCNSTESSHTVKYIVI